jgi:hypothetical protein
MSMQNQMHPDDERLAALAGGEDHVLADASLREHVTSCDRCSGVVDDLSRLRVALAELPDQVPSRPIRFLPPVDEPATAGGWWRRLFAPALLAGSGLVLVGAVGFSGVVENLASGGATGASVDLQGDGRAESEQSTVPAAQPSAVNGAPSGDAVASVAPTTDDGYAAPEDEQSGTERDPVAPFGVAADQAPWLVVMLGGAALILAALALRFAVQPRAG